MSTPAVVTVTDRAQTFHLYLDACGDPRNVAVNLVNALDYAWPLPRFEAAEWTGAFIAALKRPKRLSSSGADQGGLVRLTSDWQPHQEIQFRYEVSTKDGALSVRAFRVSAGPTCEQLFDGALEGFLIFADIDEIPLDAREPDEPILELADAATDVIASWVGADLNEALLWLDVALRNFNAAHPISDAPADKSNEAASQVIEPVVGTEVPARRRFQTAIDIVKPGACNPSGIAHALIAACREARDAGIGPCNDPAVRLIVTQLAWICRADHDTDDYDALLEECRRKAGSAEL
jgi:hypothetical protein